MRDQLVDQFEAISPTKKKPSFDVGDKVKVSTKIIEGEKERVQAFTGVVIARKGIGNSETFTVYRNAYGSSMERVFLLLSPRVLSVEVLRKGDVCKSKLYFLRGRSGKKAKIKEKIVGAKETYPREESAPEENIDRGPVVEDEEIENASENSSDIGEEK